MTTINILVTDVRTKYTLVTGNVAAVDNLPGHGGSERRILTLTLDTGYQVRLLLTFNDLSGLADTFPQTEAALHRPAPLPPEDTLITDSGETGNIMSAKEAGMWHFQMINCIPAELLATGFDFTEYHKSITQMWKSHQTLQQQLEQLLKGA